MKCLCISQWKVCCLWFLLSLYGVFLSMLRKIPTMLQTPMKINKHKMSSQGLRGTNVVTNSGAI